MILSDIRQIRCEEELAVIINVNTKYVTTLALLSSLRHAQVPVLLIECESRDGSPVWFPRLMLEYDFYLLSAPLQPHGMTLDWLFQRISSERVLLVDSDVELLNSEMLKDMRSMLKDDDTMYGSGFLHPGNWLQEHYGTGLPLASGIGYYKERPWIPFTLLRVAPLRMALAAGRSFMHQLITNEFQRFPVLSRLAWQRFRFKACRERRLRCLDRFRCSVGDLKPAYLFSDTGAEVHAYLTGQGLTFGSVPTGQVPWSISHLQGATRGIINGASADAFGLPEAEIQVRERLRNKYGMEPQ